MKKSVSLTTIILVLVLAVIVFFTANSNQLIAHSTNAESEQSQQLVSASVKGGYDWEDRKKIFEISKDEVYKYTNNQNGLSGNIDIRDYDDKNEDYKADSGIINYIPKDLFLHKGKYKFVGKEYGFYVYTDYDNWLYTNRGMTTTKHTYSVVIVSQLVNLLILKSVFQISILKKK